MKYSNYTSLVRDLTGTDSTSFPNAKMLLYTNIAKDDIAEEVVQINDDWFDIEQIANLVASQREYPFPDDLLRSVKMVEITLDGTVWKRLTEFDITSYSITQTDPVKPYNSRDIDSARARATTDETTITEQFSDNTPMYDNDGNSIVLYTESTIPAVTGGLKLRAMVYPADYEEADLSTAVDMSVRPSTVSTSMPRPSHLPMAIRTSILFKMANNMPIDELDATYEVELAKMKKKLRKKILDKTVQPRVPRDTGFEH